jgi:hypothetical protein
MSEGTGSSTKDGVDWREVVAVVLLSVTAIVTAWSGFQSSKWSGAMSISFSQASTARIQAARYETTADRKLTIQVSLYGQWLQAYQDKDTQLTDFLQKRFPEPLKSTFPLWLATKPLKNADAPATPFDMPQYVVPETVSAKASDAKADAKFAQALRYNQRGDNYTVLTVAFAAVLFFGAISSRMRTPRGQWVMLGIGIAGFVGAAILALSFPKLV